MGGIHRTGRRSRVLKGREQKGSEVMRKLVVRGLAVVCALSLLSGCVSYGEYSKLKGELELSQQANRQLIDQYNRLLVKTNRQAAEGTISEAEHKAALAQLEDLRAQLQKQQGASFTNEDVPEGAKIEEGGISLGSNLLFNSGMASLKKGSHFPSLDSIASSLKGKYAGYNIIIEGHTDNEPLNKTKKLYEYNLKLGFERATNVFKYLNLKHGIPEGRVTIFSFGMACLLYTSPSPRDRG